MSHTRRRTISTVRTDAGPAVELTPADLDAVAAGFAGAFDEPVFTPRKDAGNSAESRAIDPSAKGVIQTRGR